MSANALSAIKGKSRAIKLKKLAEAWAREAEHELQLEAGDVAPVLAAMKDALDGQLERKAQRRAG
jgi:hypothetical protein